MSPDLVFDPELRLRDGTVIRTREDAIAFARAQQPRPGADERDAVLHQLERASRPAPAIWTVAQPEGSLMSVYRLRTGGNVRLTLVTVLVSRRALICRFSSTLEK